MNYSFCILIVAVVFAVAWLVQIILQLTINRRVLSRCRSERKQVNVCFTEEKPAVSIVVYTRNQGEALMRNLPALLDSDYPDFEVIVVDDNSCDETQNVLTVMEQRSERLFHTKLTDKVRTMSHRKLALLLGVKASHGDIIVTTKAQCIPATRDWLNAMVRNFNPKTDIVIGPVVFEGRTGVVSRFCQYDLFQRMVSMFGTTLALRGYAGWGSNMAFRKHLLFDDNNKAFHSHLNIHPGEDDLFVAAMAKKHNVAVECTSEALMIDQESPIRKAWSKDRLNRAFTSKRYAFGTKFLKGLDTLTRYLCVLSGLVLVVWAAIQFDWVVFSVALLMLVIRMVLNVLLGYLTASELGIHRYLLSPVAYDLVIPVVDFVYWLRASIRNKTFYVGRV